MGSQRDATSAAVVPLALNKPQNSNLPPIDIEEQMPQFRFLASEMSLASSGRMGSLQGQALKALREAFTPTQPKQSVRLFAGRRRELKRIVSAVEEWKAHIVIFGERGYGKSSLANVVSEIARQGGITVLSCSCSAELTFEEMFRSFLREIPLPYRGIQGRGDAFKHDAARAGGNFAQLLPQGQFGATDLAEALRHLSDRHVIFRIDEFDRLKSEEVKNQIAEAIKNLSDVGARVTFLIVGVADDMDSLLGKHPSIQRNVVGVHLSLMDNAELNQLIRTGEKAADIVFEEEVRARIIALSQGLPYQAQLLCQQAGQAAIEEGARTVGPQHLARAIDLSIQLAPRALERLYEQVFQGPNHDQLKAVALAAVYAKTDEFGYFTTRAVLDELERMRAPVIGEKALPAYLQRLAAPGPERILKSHENSEPAHYAYINPIFKIYVGLRLAGQKF